MHDLVLRNAKIVDGSGRDAFTADVTVSIGRVTGVAETPGEISNEARETIECDGRPAAEVLDDYMLRDEDKELLLLTFFNHSDGNLDPFHELLHDDRAVVSLGDGGAHCGVICDALLQTFMLTHWTRDRKRGPKVPLEHAVHRMTQDTARVYGLFDRGVIAPGHKADFNVIDYDNLSLSRPEMVSDLPGGARRLLQRSRGYDATIVSGEIVMRYGEATAARPGRLIRGSQAAPA